METEVRRTPRGHAPSRSLELGTRGVLVLFFALAVVCGLFFAFGYTLGRHTVPATFQLGATPPVTSATRPSAVQNPAASTTPLSATSSGVQPPNPAELGAAENNQTPTTLVAPTTTSAGSAAGPTQQPAPASTTPVLAPPGAVAASPGATAAAPGAGPYHVQVFAGKKADAESLATALQQRGYPVEVVPPGPGESDLFFRVQVGPYLTLDEARAMRSRLTADGYQAIVK
ncbi:MAG: SPOR domain-containing protein [Terriglobales bacterium]